MFFARSTRVWAALGAAVIAGLVRAQQVEVKLTLAYNAFVVGEPVLVQVEALNATRDLIEVGGAGAKDVLFVEITRGGQYEELSPFNKEPLAGAVSLKPGQTFQHKVELDKWYALIEPGQYMVRAVLVHGGVRYESTKKTFDVVPGLPLSEGVQMFVNRQSLKRLFKLVYWHRNQNDRLFLRMEDDPGGRVWDTIDLGVLLRLSPPKIDISPEGEVTVVHRATQDAFIRTVVWSLPDNVEVVERNNLLDPEISASQRVKALYGEMTDGEGKEKKKAWWKFW
jgi:hypothetical protein